MDRQASIRGWNVLIAIGLGLLVSGLLAFFRCPISAPAVWQPLSEAIGLIPPDDPMPGLWRMVVAGLAKWVGVGSIDAALMWCGHVAVGIVTACIYLIFCNVVLHLEQLAIRHRVNWSRRLLCILSGIGTLLVAFSEPMWRMGQTFLPETLELLMTLPAVLLFVMFLRTGRVVHAGLAVAFCGVLAGETVVGLVLGLFVLAGTYFSAFLSGEAKFTFANLVIRFIAMWRLIGAFLLGFVLMLAANCVAFSDAGGLEAHGWKSVDLMIRMFHLYGMQVVSAATPIAWFVAVFAVFVPFGVTLHLMKRAADDDKFLRYSDGLIILVCSLTAILQLLPFPTFWFWNWSVVHRQVSEYLLGLFATVNALTATFGFVVFCCEIYFRNVRRIAARRYPDDTEEEEAQRALESVVELRRALRWVFWSAMTLLLCVVAWRLPCTTARELLGVVDDWRATRTCCSRTGGSTGAWSCARPPAGRSWWRFRSWRTTLSTTRNAASAAARTRRTATCSRSGRPTSFARGQTRNRSAFPRWPRRSALNCGSGMDARCRRARAFLPARTAALRTSA